MLTRHFPGYTGGDSDGEDRDVEPTLTLQSKYFAIKQQCIETINLKQEDCLSKADQDIDAELELFMSIRHLSILLSRVCARYNYELHVLSTKESATGRTIRQFAKKMDGNFKGFMFDFSQLFSLSASHRSVLKPTISRLRDEACTFRTKAITDTESTIKMMNAARTEYRGSLLWMKQVSGKLDPENRGAILKYKQVQQDVKRKLERYETQKKNVGEKIRLLCASRSNMLSSILAKYRESMLQYYTSMEECCKCLLAQTDRPLDFQYEYIPVLNKMESQLLEQQNSSDQDVDPDSSKNNDDENLLDIGEDLSSLQLNVNEQSESFPNTVDNDDLVELNFEDDEDGSFALDDELNKAYDENSDKNDDDILDEIFGGVGAFAKSKPSTLMLEMKESSDGGRDSDEKKKSWNQMLDQLASIDHLTDIDKIFNNEKDMV